ncbi:uncharacterized protein LOC124885784 [Capsicum annuum]|uniref:uncharacterized protein LOC124885784 n=1 Tax=Capsicum annuum TaxID=4072 RepID=UPI001FB17702|nr:uncharacterized protein LOC124885784 [Capsicum annuum]
MRQKDSKYQKFLSMLKARSVNIPLVKALEKMPGYAKFMKVLITKNIAVSYEPVDNVHHYSVVATKSFMEKKGDPGAFTIPYTIVSFNFACGLCDLDSSINLMPFEVFKKLGLGASKSASMRLVMTDRMVKKQVGIRYDVLVKLDKLRLIFVIDMYDEEEDSILNVDAVTLWDDSSDMIILINERLGVEALVAVIINFNVDGMEEYEEIVGALHGNAYYDYAPKKHDLDLKNRNTPPAHPSIKDPPILEIKSLPSHLRYTVLGANNTLSVIIAANLRQSEVEPLFSVL